MTMRRLLPDPALLPAAVSGLLMACAFPSVDLGMLAWVGLVPLLLVMRQRPFKSGFVAGLTFFAGVLYWLNIVMTTYGGLPMAASVIAYLMLVTYLALFWGTATWAACRLNERKGYPYSLTFPVFWVALEFLRAFLLTGFPWANLGYSQHGSMLTIQSADLFGVYGIAYLLVLCNTVVAESVRAMARRTPGGLPGKALVFTLVLILANSAYGWWRLDRGPAAPDGEPLAVGLVQGNVDQSLKWDPAYQQETVSIYRHLSLRAEQSAPLDLLVWPEAAMPFYFQEGGALAGQVRSLPREIATPLLFGSPAYLASQDGFRYLNSAFLLDGDGRLLGRSDKVHLVPFGEYVPLGRFLPFVEKLVVGIGDFSPGRLEPLGLDGHQLGVLVCYEVIFPELARDYVLSGSDLLVNITNDAWFGTSSAPWQHLSMAVFRAVENRVWLVRAANTGISALISPDGRVTEQTALFERTLLTGKVRWGAAPSLYSRFGDLLPGLFLAVGVLWLVQTRRRMI